LFSLVSTCGFKLKDDQKDLKDPSKIQIESMQQIVSNLSEKELEIIPEI